MPHIMQRRHFDIIAAAMAQAKPIQHNYPPPLSPGQPDLLYTATAQWERTIAAIMAAAKADNPKFDEERFLDACQGQLDPRSTLRDPDSILRLTLPQPD